MTHSMQYEVINDQDIPLKTALPYTITLKQCISFCIGFYLNQFSLDCRDHKVVLLVMHRMILLKPQFTTTSIKWPMDWKCWYL